MREVECGFVTSELLATFGPTVRVQIGFDLDFHLAGAGRPDLPDALWPALVDTGATESCIDSVLALDLNLPVVDRVRIGGVGGPTDVNLHLAQLYVPDLDWIVYGSFAGVHLTAGGQPHRALIGRTFLRSGFIMIYDGGTGSVALTRP